MGMRFRYPRLNTRKYAEYITILVDLQDRLHYFPRRFTPHIQLEVRRMLPRSLVRVSVGLLLSAVALACGPSVGEPPKEDEDDIATALAALPEAEVLQSTDDGVPTYIRGELG